MGKIAIATTKKPKLSKREQLLLKRLAQKNSNATLSPEDIRLAIRILRGTHYNKVLRRHRTRQRTFRAPKALNDVQVKRILSA